MQYAIREMHAIMSREMVIENLRGERLFLVHGPVVRARDELHIDDAQGVEQARVKEPLLSDRKSYEIYRGGAEYARVGMVDVGNLLEGFDIVVKGQEPLRARGDMLHRQFTIVVPRGVAARVHRRNDSTVEVGTRLGRTSSCCSWAWSRSRP